MLINPKHVEAMSQLITQLSQEVTNLTTQLEKSKEAEDLWYKSYNDGKVKINELEMHIAHLDAVIRELEEGNVKI